MGVALCEAGTWLYLQREWARAREQFLAALAARPGDRPARMLAERCVAYESNPPPADWQGVVAMATK